MKKQMIVVATVATLSVAGLAGGAAFATTQNGSGSDRMSNLVNAIATKFNLKTADVQAVFDTNRAQMQAQREQTVKDQVAQLVKDSKLTQEQADKINTKRAELQKERDVQRMANQNLTDTERQAKHEEMRAKMETKRTELDTWLKDNGIDSQYHYLLMGGRDHGRGGHHDGGPRGGSSDMGASTSSSN